ncbi:MAG: MFS transporter [Lachnospiraceae bacterium]|nr:MFS transporter [Lachnospiraceae bacterium]
MKFNWGENKSKYIRIIAVVVLAVLAIILWNGRNMLFLGTEYKLTNVQSVYCGTDGNTIVIEDEGEKSSVINRDKELVEILNVQLSDLYSVLRSITQSEDGKIYIGGEKYVDDEWESGITCYENGKYSTFLTFDDKYLIEMQVYDGTFYLLAHEETGLGIYSYEEGGELTLLKSVGIGDYISSISYDVTTGAVVTCDQRGNIRIIRDDSTSWITVKNDKEHVIPWVVTARNGIAYFSDMNHSRICRFFEDDTEHIETVLQDENMRFLNLDVSQDGSRIICSDYINYHEIKYNDDGSIDHDYVEKVDNPEFGKTLILWIIAAVMLVILAFLLKSLPGKIVRLLKNESSLRVILVVLAVVTVASFISWSFLSDSFEKQDREDVSSMKLFTDLLVDGIDTDLVEKIRWETDYNGSSYMKLREYMIKALERAEGEGKWYRFIIYEVLDEKLRALMNADGSVTCGVPAVVDDLDRYMEVYEKGTTYALERRDAEGYWLAILSPIKNKDGDIVAIIEVVDSLSDKREEQFHDAAELLFSVFCSAAVIMILIIEVLFLISFMERKRAQKASAGRVTVSHSISLRMVLLLSYGAATIQDAFITTISAKLYEGNLPVTEGVAAGLPLAGELLMMTVFAVIGGRMTGRIGTKKTLYIGILIELVGFAVCAVPGTYFGILIGNILVGIGMGLINVTANTLAAMGDTVEETSGAFADVMAGTLSGITVGAGLASLIYPIGGSKMAYIVAACMAAPVILLIRGSSDVRTEKTSEGNEEGEITKFGFRQFFFNKRVLGFFALILVPFMISISYREYFVPVYAAENGMSENRVGQIFLLCGLFVIYIGPQISKRIIKRFGTFKSILIASIAMGLNMFLFVLKPSMVTAITGMFILSGITSFAYTCQYTFLEQLPDSAKYGDSRAMGIYSLFENFGQTIGPVIYGLLLGFGYRIGLAVMGGVLLLFTVVYTVMVRKDGRVQKNG